MRGNGLGNGGEESGWEGVLPLNNRSIISEVCDGYE